MEWASIEEGKLDEQKPLLDKITSRQRKSPDSDSGQVRYADINSNEASKSGNIIPRHHRQNLLFLVAKCEDNFS